MTRTPVVAAAGFTATEVIAALSRLEPRLTALARADGRPLLTLRQLRYLDSPAVGCVQPARVPGSTRGRRLYRVIDVVLVRLALRVAAQRSTWQAWCALAYLGEELRTAIAQRRALALMFRGARAVLAPIAPSPADADVYPLRPCAEGVEAALRAARGADAKIWNGWQHVSPRALAVGTSAARE